MKDSKSRVGKITAARVPTKICCICGSDKTYVYKAKNKPNAYEYWHIHDDQWYCQKCYNRVITNPKFHEKYNPNDIMFKGKSIHLSFNPRTGVCSLCRKQGKTHMHHMKYHEDDVLKDTIELCISCHNLEHYHG